MSTFVWSEVFQHWLRRLRDQRARDRILVRLRAADLGNFGDWAFIANGVYEMRVHSGAGYRVYFARFGERVFILTGGDKSTQRRDIKLALAMKRQLEKV
jgi:putative addiction module killer protein